MRSASSTTSSQEASPSRTSFNWSGWHSSSCRAVQMRLTVVSYPAVKSRIRLSTSSFSLSRTPSSSPPESRAAISTLVMSSPGCARRYATTSAMVTSMSTAFCCAASTVIVVSKKPLMILCRGAHDRSGIPNSSKTIRVGSSCANSARRSTTRPGGSAARPSSSPSTTSSILGLRAATRREANAAATGLRRRVCSSP